MGELTAMNDTTMTKADLVEEVIRATELPRKESEAIVETIFDSIIQALQTGDKIEIRGFGSFRTRQRRGRVGRNPKTGAKVEVPPEAHSLFQAQQRTQGFRQRRCRSGCRCCASASALSIISATMDYLWTPWRYSLYRRGREGRAVAFFALRRRRHDDAQSLIVFRGQQKFRDPEPLSLHLGPRHGGSLRASGDTHGLGAGNPHGDDGAGAAARRGARKSISPRWIQPRNEHRTCRRSWHRRTHSSPRAPAVDRRYELS